MHKKRNYHLEISSFGLQRKTSHVSCHVISCHVSCHLSSKFKSFWPSKIRIRKIAHADRQPNHLQSYFFCLLFIQSLLRMFILNIIRSNLQDFLHFGEKVKFEEREKKNQLLHLFKSIKLAIEPRSACYFTLYSLVNPTAILLLQIVTHLSC